MLEYFKVILQKVSFDAGLFEKELRKAIKYLLPSEVKDLEAWCYGHFGQRYQLILNNCFNS